jgi:hypothetical protein
MRRGNSVRASIADMSRWSLGSRALTLTIDDEAVSRITSGCHLDTARPAPAGAHQFSRFCIRASVAARCSVDSR